MTAPLDLPVTDRRSFLRLGGGLAALGVAGTPLLSACGGLQSDPGTPSASGSGGRTIKIGYVSPQTGALAPFGEADSFVLGQVQKQFAAQPLVIGGQPTTIEVLVRDSQSDSKRAGDVTAELIGEQVNLMLVSSTPDTTNPVADQCEANGVPCISTMAPWQPWLFGRGGTPDKPFNWTYHFFWGLEDVESVFLDMWNQVDGGKKVAALWPNDPDGKAWGDPKTGFPPVIGQQGYSVIDPGFYANGTTDFTAQISQFKSEGADLLAGVPIPPDFITFWKQAAQQGFQPKLATVGKALLFPSTVAALGDLGNNLGTEVWWSPTHPYTSSLSKQTAQQLAAAYTAETGKQWTQPIGFVHALFEVAVAVLTASGAPDDKQSIINVLKTLKISTVCGDLDWTSGPSANVAKTPLVGGQWRKSGDAFELTVVSNANHPEIPAAGKVQALR